MNLADRGGNTITYVVTKSKKTALTASKDVLRKLKAYSFQKVILKSQQNKGNYIKSVFRITKRRDVDSGGHRRR